MSTYWFPFCRTCNTDEGRICWWNHGVDRGLLQVIKLMPQFGALARAYAVIGGNIELNISVPGPEWQSGLLDFAAKHGDHEVVAKNEYGGFDGDCHDYYVCPHCNHQKLCGKAAGHEGEHGEAPK